VSFFYGARRPGDLICASALSSIRRQLPQLSYVPAVSEPDITDEWFGETGLITDVIDRSMGNLRGAEGYLCGPPGMIDAASDVLKAHGMFGSRIRYDKFVSTAGGPDAR